MFLMLLIEFLFIAEHKIIWCVQNFMLWTNPVDIYLLKVRKKDAEMTLKVMKKQLLRIFFQLIVMSKGTDN